MSIAGRRESLGPLSIAAAICENPRSKARHSPRQMVTASPGCDNPGLQVSQAGPMRFPFRTPSAVLPSLAALICALLLASCTGDDHLSVYTPVGELPFADAALKSCVLRQAARRGWTQSGQFTRLICTNPEGEPVRDVRGIENLVNLQLLNLAHNQITDIGSIDRLSRLSRLDLGYNLIEQARIRHLGPTLRVLIIDHNRLADVSWIASLRHIEELSMSHNNIQDLSAFARLASLESLNLSNNSISEVSPLAGLKSLRELDLGDNEVADVAPLGGLPRLVMLRLDGNRVSNVDGLAEMPYLEELDLSGNQLTDVAAIATIFPLQYLNLANNDIRDPMSLEELGSIEALDLTGNPAACEGIEALEAALGPDTVIAGGCAD